MTSTVKLYDVENPKLPFGLTYWQMAAIGIGLVPVVGLGVWYYRKNRQTISKKKDVDKEKTQQNGLGDNKISPDVSRPRTKITQEQKSEDSYIQKSPLENAQSLKDSGNQFFKEGKYTDAIRCYSEAIELCPTSEQNILSTFYQNRGACYDQLGNLEATIKDCTSALKLNPKYTKALTRRAKALQSIGKLKECLEDVTSVCILENFQNNRSLEMADTVLKELGRQHASDAMANKEPIQASPHFVKSFFKSFPNDPVVNVSNFGAQANSTLLQDGESSVSHLERAKQLLYQGKYDEVIPACTEAVEHGEGLEPEALLLRATMYLVRGQHSLALEDLNTIINSEVQNNKITVNALIKRASLHLQERAHDKSFEDFEAAEKLDPDNPDIYVHRGQVNLLSDNIDQSIKDFQKCINLDPMFATGVMQLHYANYRQYLQQNSMSGIAKTIEKFKRDIKKHPKCSEGYILLAQVLMDQQQYDEADKYFQSAIEMDPNNATLRVHRGLLQLQWRADINTAINYINEGIQVDDKCSFCYETLGTIEVQRGNLKKAVEIFNKAVPLSKTELELSHIFSLRDAAAAQLVVAERLSTSGFMGT